MDKNETFFRAESRAREVSFNKTFQFQFIRILITFIKIIYWLKCFNKSLWCSGVADGQLIQR